MLSTVAIVQVLFSALLGSAAGYLAYCLATRFERIAVSTLAPLSFITYLALFGFVKVGFEAFGSQAWIGIFVCVALWGSGIVLRESAHTLFERISFFGAALFFACGILLLSAPVVIPAILFADLYILRLDDELGVVISLFAYAFSMITSVFAVPLWEHLFRLAMSMRPKPN